MMHTYEYTHQYRERGKYANIKKGELDPNSGGNYRELPPVA